MKPVFDNLTNLVTLKSGDRMLSRPTEATGRYLRQLRKLGGEDRHGGRKYKTRYEHLKNQT